MWTFSDVARSAQAGAGAAEGCLFPHHVYEPYGFDGVDIDQLVPFCSLFFPFFFLPFFIALDVDLNQGIPRRQRAIRPARGLHKLPHLAAWPAAVLQLSRA